MSFFYTYQLTLPDGRFYIGSRKTKVKPTEDLGIRYKSSSRIVNDIGFLNFVAEILKTYDDYESCYWDEQKLIRDNWDKKPKILNRHYLDPDTKKHKFSTEGRKISDKMRKRLSFLASNRSRETRKKMSDSHMGKRPSSETRLKMSTSHRKTNTQEMKDKISKGLRGHAISEETKRKISESRKRWWEANPHIASEQTDRNPCCLRSQ